MITPTCPKCGNTNFMGIRHPTASMVPQVAPKFLFICCDRCGVVVGTVLA